MTKITMSLNQIKEYKPCAEGVKTLLKSRGGLSANYDEQIPLLDILESNGIEDTIWCFRVNWTTHKSVYMQFVNNCVKRANNYAADAAVYAADAAAERQKQHQDLINIINSIESSNCKG